MGAGGQIDPAPARVGSGLCGQKRRWLDNCVYRSICRLLSYTAFTTPLTNQEAELGGWARLVCLLAAGVCLCEWSCRPPRRSGSSSGHSKEADAE